MLLLLRYCLCLLARMFVSLRYRVRVQGLEQIRGLKGPVLVLPNHPGLNDPLLVLSAIWPILKPRPMVYEGNFTNPFMRLLMKLLNAVRVPALDQASAKAALRAQQAVEVVIAGLRNGDEPHPLAVRPHSARRQGTARRRPRPGRHSASGAAGDDRAGANARSVGQHVQLRSDRRTSQPHRPLCGRTRLADRQPAPVRAAPPGGHHHRARRAQPAAGTAPRDAQSLARSLVQRQRRAGDADLCALSLRLRPAHLRVSQTTGPGRSRCLADQAGDPRSGDAHDCRQARPAADRRRIEAGHHFRSAGPGQPRSHGVEPARRAAVRFHLGSSAGDAGATVGAGAGVGGEGTAETAAAGLVRWDRRPPAVGVLIWRFWATPSPKPSSPAPSGIRATWSPPTTWPASSPTNAC